jgi:hypothetical protein
MVEIWDTAKDFVGNPACRVKFQLSFNNIEWLDEISRLLQAKGWQKGVTGEKIIKHILEK